MFEVYDYLGGNMNGVQDKYPTWTVSRAAYLKQLGIVEKKLFIQTIQPDMDDVVAWSTQHTKATAVAAKVQYLKDLISQDSLDIDEISKHMKDLKSHIAYLDKEAAQRAARKKAGKSLSQGFDDDAYSQERKNNAYYFKSKTGNNQAAYDQADAFMSHYAEQNWKDWNDKQKHVAYLYTSGSRYVNEPLFGTYYSTKVSPHDGSIRDSWKDINTLTDMIENSERLQHDMWVVHGENTAAFMGKFNVDLSRMSEADAQKLIGQIGWNAPFTSTGCSFGSGFSSQDVIMNIYCPKGTKGIYVEPYSHYGDSGYGEKAMNWNGKSRQAAGYKTSYENELLLQRGTSFRITKIEKRGWTWYVDVEVVEQPVMKHNTIR